MNNRVGPCLLLFGLVLCSGPTFAVQVWVSDSMSGAVGDTVLIPILVSGQVGQNVIAADITMNFGEAVLTATNGYVRGNAAPDWMVYTNPFSCSLLIAMASATPLVAGDTLLQVKMVVDSADTTTIWFSRCRLNEGAVACTTRAGKFYGYETGVEEGLRPPALAHLAAVPSPVREVVWLLGQGPALLVSANGQKVLVLKPGPNCVARLPRGVYFVREQLQATGLKPQAMRKVVIARE